MNEDMQDISGYKWNYAHESCAHKYLLPQIYKLLDEIDWKDNNKRIFDLGCGNGATAKNLTNKGFDVTGVDPSTEGIAQIYAKTPNLKLYEGSCYEPLDKKYGKYPVVISLEVIEHIYSPRKFANCVYSLLEKNGTAIISTPYHGYLKNLAISITGKMDAHFTALWDNGHIKFWSERTLSILLKEVGFNNIHFKRIGRVSCIAKAMIAIAKK